MATESSKEQGSKRTRGKPFAPGKSGNPGGRPRTVAEVRALASTYSEAAIRGLVAIAKNPGSPPAAQVAAWREVLDRAHGRAPQALEVDLHASGPDELSQRSLELLTDEELEQLERIQAKVEARRLC